MVTPVAQREAVAHLRDHHGMSERRACRVIDADRKSVRYQSRRPPETELRARLRELANERRRFGYRRLHILLRREGEPSGINHVYRLYRERSWRSQAPGTAQGGRHTGSDPRGGSAQCPLEPGLRP
jgi:transposase InsO family protein